MGLKLYFDFLSQPSRALYIFLKTCNIPFEQCIVKFADGAHRSAEFEEINPFCKVPVIDHDGFKLTESVGIARYINREFAIADHWYPKSSPFQARVDEYLEWQHLNTRITCSRLFLGKVFFPMMRQIAQKPSKVQDFEKNVHKCLDTIENKWLMEQLFVAGDEISVADLFAACEIEQTRFAGYDPRQGRPKLTSWFERVRQKTTPHYEEAHKCIDDVIMRLNGREPHTCSVVDIFS